MISFMQFLMEYEGHIDDGQGNTFWGKKASGVLPIANDTKRICLALRSAAVTSLVNRKTTHIRCWGTFGGAFENESPEENAKDELGQESGYRGSIQMHPAFVFTSGSFRYYNFLGLIPSEEITLAPESGSSWETDDVQWFTYDDILKSGGNLNGYPFHDGLKDLFRNSKAQIETLVKPSQEMKRPKILQKPEIPEERKLERKFNSNTP